MEIHPMVQSMEHEIIHLRRALHQIPEIGYTEKRTQAFILNYVKKLKPDEIIIIAGTGVKVVFYAKGATRTTGFRTDIDGLAMQEKNQTDYASSIEGRMHGCGHDGHMSIMLCFAKLVSANREKIKDNIVILFQPAEEHIGGAKRMVEEGCLENPDIDRIFGMHVWPSIPAGKIGMREGATMAQTCEFDVRVLGKSAHGATPQEGIDAIVATAEIINALQAIITRIIGPNEKAVITIGRVVGGEARNIIADNVEMNGTVRSFKDEVHEKIVRNIHNVLNGIELVSGVKTEFTEVMHYPVVNNPTHMCEEFANIFDCEDIVSIDEIMAAEDFSFYQQKVPGLFVFLGIADEKCNYPLHNCRFDFNEKHLLGGVEIYRRIVGIN